MQGVVGVGTEAAGALFSGVFGLNSPEGKGAKRSILAKTPQQSPPTSKNGHHVNTNNKDAISSIDDILMSALSVDDEFNALWIKNVEGLSFEDACIQLNSLAIAPSSIICLRDTISADNNASIKSLSLISQVFIYFSIFLTILFVIDFLVLVKRMI